MTRLTIAVLVFMMVQAITFFTGAVLVLATPLADRAWELMPWVVGLSVLVAAPVAWFIAPMLRARYWGAPRGPQGERQPGDCGRADPRRMAGAAPDVGRGR